MFETLLQSICENAHHAGWVIFALLLLSGFCLPISEDFLLIGGGVIASTCYPGPPYQLFIWLFLGCYLSAWEAYWLGRILGPRLHQFSLFKRTLSPERISKIKEYYIRFGIFTFIVGRFLPGGVRNTIFISSGFIHMPFPLFILRDGIACLISTHVFFFTGYFFGKNLSTANHYLRLYEEWVFALFVLIVICFISFFWYKRTYMQINKDDKLDKPD